ncbi:uncharacterized protein LOC132745631 [Ruditapes philippinarum]|uniref:uncharacterized protein LOC132745631 n=1 Tax=Ruditapes philippinarum TaxID=129788 RepID=UPI00295BB370|nr:uncharacterized protein LOC132745631 [Ruditapes philippinarum]
MAASTELVTKDTACVEHTEVVFESDLLTELLSSQKQAAQFLELAHLALRDDPDIASEVRMTANESQDQHLKTHSLVKEYQGTALHVIHTMLPIIQTGIKKKKELLVMKTLKKVLTYVDEMISKTDKTIDKYYDIKKAVNKERTYINKKNKEIQIRGSEIEVEMNREKRMLKEDSEDLKALQSSKEKKEEKMEQLKSKREDFIANSGSFQQGYSQKH